MNTQSNMIIVGNPDTETGNPDTETGNPDAETVSQPTPHLDTETADLQTNQSIPPPNTPLINLSQSIQDEKHAKTMLLIEQRENQRAELLKQVLGFSITIIGVLYIVAVAVFGLIFWKMPEDTLVKLADFWHILLIFLLPPTSLLMMLIRGVSFSANSSEFKSSDNKDDSLDIPTPTAVIWTELKDTPKKVVENMVGKILPSQKDKQE